MEKVKPKHLEFGSNMEKAAAELLQKKGMLIIEKNYRCKTGEIDLIAEENLALCKQKALVFVEVRARTKGKAWVNAIESVDFKKRRKLTLTARHFLMHYQGSSSQVRFDILAWDGQVWTHVENAWFY